MNSNLKKRLIAAAAVMAVTLESAGGAFINVNEGTPLFSVSVSAADKSAAVTSEKTGIQTGQSIQGFTVKEIKSYSPLQADIILLEHDKTGAKLLYIANEDTERSFNLAFHTIADDETGKPHVFEHATLNGSDKYPADAFFNVSYQTFNTFMNAVTMPVQTSYPIASLSEDQLLRYADYYTDACFHPLILKDETAFKQEAWRYRLDSADSQLSIEGTVYSEMLGAADLASQAMCANYRAAFPGSTISNEYGGLPEHIPELTYDALKAYHAEYYRPSNCIATLYGKIDDFESFAKLLNKEFSRYKQKDFDFSDKNYRPISSPVTHYEAFPVSADSDTTGQTIIYRDYILRDISNEDLKKVTILASVLSDSNSPLMTAITRKYPQAYVSVSVDPQGPENLLSVTVSNVDKKDASRISSMIDKSLEKIAEEGISDTSIEKISHAIKASNLLSGEGSMIGVMYSMYISLYYHATGDVWFFTDVNSDNNIESYNKNGVFKDLLNKYVTDNYLRVLSVTYPEQGLLEKKEADTAEALAEKQASMSKSEIKALVKETKAFDSRIGADAEAVADIVSRVKGVSLADLPEELPDIKVNTETLDNNISLYTAPVDISGVGAAEALIDISDFTVEEAMWVQLYLEIMFNSDTKIRTKADINDLADTSMLGLTSGIDVYTDDDGDEFTPYLKFQWAVLDEDIGKSFEVLNEVLTQTKVGYVSKIKGAAKSARNNIAYSISDGGYSMIANGGFENVSGCDNYLYRINYLDYYDFLGNVLSRVEEDPRSVVYDLVHIRRKLTNAYGSIYAYSGSEEGIESFKTAAAGFADSMGSKKKIKADYEKSALSDAIIINSGANFNYMLIDFKDLGLENPTAAELTELQVVADMISDAYLLPYVRNYFGAYGAGAEVIAGEGLMLYTYRDPNITESYAVFAALADYLDSFEIDAETLEGYAMYSYSNLINSSGNLDSGCASLESVISGIDRNKSLGESMHALKSITPERVNEIKAYFAYLARNGRCYTVGSASSINANKDMFTSVAAPFNN